MTHSRPPGGLSVPGPAVRRVGEPAEGAAVAVESAVAEAFREEWGQVVATLIRITGDWDLAEECAQEAFAVALRTWPRGGVPGRPGAWLAAAARGRAAGRRRRGAAGAAGRRGAARGRGPGGPES